MQKSCISKIIFPLFAAILIAILVFTAKFIVSPCALTKPKIDVLSCVTSAVGFGGLVIGVGLASSYSRLSAPVLICLLFGIGSAAGAAACASKPVAFTNDVHYGLYCTLIPAVLGFVIARTLSKGKNTKNEY